MVQRLKKSWWLYLLLFLLGLFHLQNFGKDSFSTFFTIVAFVYPFLVFISIWFWTHSKGHQPIYLDTKLNFDDVFLYFERDDNETKLNPNTIQNIVSNSEYWLLYISKGQFIYIPKNIFYSKEDYKKFSTLINFKS